MIFVCPHCQYQHSVSPQAVGRRIRCPQCDALVEVTVPAPAPPPPPDPPAALPPKNTQRPAKVTPPSATVEMSAGDAGRFQTTELKGLEPVALEAVTAWEPDAPPIILTSGPWKVAEIPAGVHHETPPPPEEPAAPPPAPRKFQPKKGEPMGEAEMDMTPMVDCVFNLLIFFMVTASFTTSKSMAIPKPQSEKGTSALPQQEVDETLNSIIVRIDAQNTYYITEGDKETECPSKQELMLKLRQARQTLGPDSAAPSMLVVQAHGDCLHEAVVSAIDAGNDVGMERVQLQTIEDDDLK